MVAIFVQGEMSEMVTEMRPFHPDLLISSRELHAAFQWLLQGLLHDSSPHFYIIEVEYSTMGNLSYESSLVLRV